MSEEQREKQFREGLDLTEPGDINEYHTRKVQWEVEKATESDAFYLTASEEARGGSVVGLTFLGIIGGLLLAPEPMFAMIGGLFFGALGFFTLTRNGVIARRSFMDVQKTQQQEGEQSSPSKPTRLCGSCGWQNPKDNNYCHDCGDKLGED